MVGMINLNSVNQLTLISAHAAAAENDDDGDSGDDVMMMFQSTVAAVWRVTRCIEG